MPGEPNTNTNTDGDKVACCVTSDSRGGVTKETLESSVLTENSKDRGGKKPSTNTLVDTFASQTGAE